MKKLLIVVTIFISSFSQAQQEVSQQYPEDNIVSGRPSSFFLDEINDVIRARGLQSLQDYQLVNRVGRGIGLDRERHRPIVWQIYERYQQLLDENQLVDFSDLPRLVLKQNNSLQKHDVVIFVSGKKSSNGKALYGVCKRFNDRSYFVGSEEEIDLSWINPTDSIGICGATSTPMWLMEQVSTYINDNCGIEVVE